MLYDQEMIYARIIGLMSSNRPVPIDACLSTELAAYPPALFDSAGMMRVSKKSILKTDLQITTPEPLVPAVETAVYDVSALLWTINRPTGTLKLYVDALKAFVMKALIVGNVVFVFDRYFEDSPKAYCRLLRQEKQGMSRIHILKTDMPTPPRSAIIGVCKNKMQLNRMIAEALADPDFYIPATQNGNRSRCMQGENVRVISDDTDVFLLLLHFYVAHKCTSAL